MAATTRLAVARSNPLCPFNVTCTRSGATRGAGWTTAEVLVYRLARARVRVQHVPRRGSVGPHRVRGDRVAALEAKVAELASSWSPESARCSGRCFWPQTGDVSRFDGPQAVIVGGARAARPPGAGHDGCSAGRHQTRQPADALAASRPCSASGAAPSSRPTTGPSPSGGEQDGRGGDGTELLTSLLRPCATETSVAWPLARMTGRSPGELIVCHGPLPASPAV